GKSDPAKLPRGVYLGARVCRSCHVKEYNDWLSTPHSVSFSSLVKKGINSYLNRECQKCHVTGFHKPGGFFSFTRNRFLVNVQCEVCHGIAGGHQARTSPEKEDYKKICLNCHTEKYSLKFSFDKAYELVSHTGDSNLSAYPEEVRQRIIHTLMRERLKKTRLGVAYVGSEVCRDCHRKKYEFWKKTKHSSSYNTLAAKGRQKIKVCLRCHTTGYGHEGGFDVDRQNNRGLAAVGCEVCHGPGGDHVKARGDDLKQTIFGLSGKCKYCVVTDMCQACHDRKNSPKFNIDTYLKLVKH
ncbi:MAG: multiheme c-type cytochrome, partial [Calditrichia bacterium]